MAVGGRQEEQKEQMEEQEEVQEINAICESLMSWIWGAVWVSTFAR
jgi:hypothetical protein